MNALSVRGLTKTYRNGVQALKGVDLEVERGDFFALLGPNGAGKTTLIGIITSLVNKTAGEARVFGYDIDHELEAAKACIGIVPQELNFNMFETPYTIVVNQAGFYGIPRAVARQRAEKYLKQLQLWERRRSISRSLSGGMKRRLMIARALVHEPRLLILDEPTAGVDIEIRRSMWEFLREINDRGTTIILTTHYLEEAETLCRNIAIINGGRIVERDRMSSLLRRLPVQTFVLNLRDSPGPPPHLDGFAPTPVHAPPVNLGVVRWIGFQTIVIREYGRIIRIWGQTIVPSVVTATLYFVIFGSLIGRRVGVMGGFDYKQYIAPGLIMMSVITNSYGNVVASFFGAKFGKHVEELLVSPLPNWVIVAGYATGGLVRGLLVGTAVTVVSLLFTHLQVQHLSVILAAGLLTSLIFALGGFLNVLFAKNFDQVKWIPTFILTPLTYFGGVFYSITLLPPWAQQVSYINPILHMVNAFRFGFLGVSDVSIGLAFALMALAAAALFALAVALMNRGTGIRE